MAMNDPALLAASLATAAFGVGSLWHGRKTEQPPLFVGGLLLAVAPWFFDRMDHMLGFAFGIALPMLLFTKKK
jgi:hypothetical protein